MNKEEMLWCLAEIATDREVQVDWNSKTKEQNFKALSICDELNCDIEDIVGSTETHIVDIIENTYRNAEDNDEILLIFRITRKSDNSIGYLRFRGRYSSWDSSSYYTCDVVYPKQISTTIYETKLEKSV